MVMEIGRHGKPSLRQWLLYSCVRDFSKCIQAYRFFRNLQEKLGAPDLQEITMEVKSTRMPACGQ